MSHRVILPGKKANQNMFHARRNQQLGLSRGAFTEMPELEDATTVHNLTRPVSSTRCGFPSRELQIRSYIYTCQSG